MCCSLFCVGQDSITGLTMTSSSPPPMAYTVTAIKSPVNASGSISGRMVSSDMRQQNGCPVADAVQKPCGEQINSQLDAEIDRNKQRDFCKRDLICPLEHNEQQGNEVVDDCLHNIADIAGQNRLTAGVFHGNTSNSVHYRLYIISVKTLQVPRGLKKFFDLLQKILDKHALQAYISWHDKTVDADE